MLGVFEGSGGWFSGMVPVGIALDIDNGAGEDDIEVPVFGAPRGRANRA